MTNHTGWWPPRRIEICIVCWLVTFVSSLGCNRKVDPSEPTELLSRAYDTAPSFRRLIVLPPYRLEEPEGDVQVWEVGLDQQPEVLEIDGRPYLFPRPSLDYDHCAISVRDPINAVMFMDDVPAALVEARSIFQVKASGKQNVPMGTRVAVVVRFWSEKKPEMVGRIEGDIIVVGM